MRGLKQFHEPETHAPVDVAPYVGAWVETASSQRKRWEQAVAPYVGAWVETLF